jgi:hypothetical protein
MRSCAAASSDPAYVRAVETGAPRSLAESQGFCWDASSNTQQGTKTLLQQAVRLRLVCA